MSRFLKVFIIILILVLIVPAIGLIKWTFKPKKSIQLLVLDKTVPTLERHKHQSFNWVLNHEKYVKSNNRPYWYKKDYFGFFPLRPLRNRQYEIDRIRLADIIDLAEEYDGAYYTDTYGVYFNDWYQGINKNRRSRKIYGGLLANDYSLMMELKKRKKLIIGEYNILAYPTPDLERSKVESLLDIHSTGWIGKYYSCLDTVANPDFPEWMLELYRKQYQQAWPFKKSGIVLIQYDSKVVVLENETHLDFEVPYIYTTDYGMKKFHVPYQMNYPYWFEIVQPGNNRVVSSFRLHVNEKGDSVLTNNFIPFEFPAVLESTTDAPHYYFAGDFADNEVKPFLAYFNGISKLAPIWLYNDELSDRRKFFWKFYKPLINSILEEHAGKKK